MRVLAALALVIASVPVGAVPPVQPFPATTRPLDGAALPANGRVLVFGSNEVALEDIGIALSVEGAPAEASVARIGCCTVEIVPADPIVPGAAVELLVSAAGGDSAFSFTGAPANDVTPALGVPEIVQAVTAARLVAPMTPREGPAWAITIDVADVTGAVALATYDDDGAIVTIEPTTGAPFERVISGAAGVRSEACITVEARGVDGARTRAAPVCTTLPAHDAPPREPPSTPAGCSSSRGAGASLALFALLALLTRRRRTCAALACAALATACVSGCSGRTLDTVDSQRLCADAVVDHTFPGAAFSDAFFDARAREEYGWVAAKGLIVDPLDVDRRRVGFYDNDVYALHDEWFYFRLMNGWPACGADDIVPFEGTAFDDVDAIKDWARAQDRLPPFLSWADERLTAPDFYRLSRNSEPRRYVPFYLTRDVDAEPRAYAMRVAGPDVLDRAALAATFAVLDPLMPDGVPLYWTPSRRRPAQTDFADELLTSADPLGDRVRWD